MWYNATPKEQYHTAADGLPDRLQHLAERAPQVAPTLVDQTAEIVAVARRWQREGGDQQIALVWQGRRPRR